MAYSSHQPELLPEADNSIWSGREIIDQASADSTNDFAKQLAAKYVHEDADLIIETSTPVTYWWAGDPFHTHTGTNEIIETYAQPDGTCHFTTRSVMRFKVHSQRLAAASTYFKNMLVIATASPGSSASSASYSTLSDDGTPPSSEEEYEPLVQGTGRPLPVAKVIEQPLTMACLLGAIYQTPELMVDLSGIEWAEVVKVWEAANKYELHLLGSLAAHIVEARMPQLSVSSYIHGLLRASVLGNTNLIARLEKELAGQPMTVLARSSTSVLPSNQLLRILTLQAESLRGIKDLSAQLETLLTELGCDGQTPVAFHLTDKFCECLSRVSEIKCKVAKLVEG